MTAKIRAPLKKGEKRRHAVVAEDDPARLRLVHVVSLRHPDPQHKCADDPKCCAVWKAECKKYALEHIGLAITYAKNLHSSHIPEDDLIHAAVLGLLEAIKRFKLSKAGRFSTYAVWRMRYECDRLLYEDEAGIVKLPGQLRDDVRDVDATVRRLASLLGRDAEDPEILAALQEQEATEVSQWEVVVKDITENNPGAEGELPKKPNERWKKASVEKVREARETYAGAAYAQVDPRSSTDDETEKKLAIRQVLKDLSPVLQAILAEEYDIEGVDRAPLPECPVARATGLQLGLNLLRRFLGG